MLNPQHKTEAIEWAKKILQSGNWCLIDTETTGLGDTAQICQIAAISATNLDGWQTHVRPTCPIELEAQRIHKISDADVANAPTFDIVWLDLLRQAGRADIVIYNAEFDLRMIRQSLRPHGIHLAFPSSDRRGCKIFTNGGAIHCAMLEYSRLCGEWNYHHGDYRWQKLPGGDHTALGDCRATLTIIQRMSVL